MGVNEIAKIEDGNLEAGPLIDGLNDYILYIQVTQQMDLLKRLFTPAAIIRRSQDDTNREMSAVDV